MTKALTYDLHFEKYLIMTPTDKGIKFVCGLEEGASFKDVYKLAIAAGLHCSFETNEVKNNLVN